MPLRGVVRGSVLLAIALAAWLVVSAAQEPEVPSPQPLLVGDLTAPGTDRGLRANDPPRAPRTAATAQRMERPGRNLPYEPAASSSSFEAAPRQPRAWHP